MVMPLAEIRSRLEANRSGPERKADEWPAVRLFTPLAEGVWLLSQIDARDPDRAFGLCDEGQGSPHLGPVSLQELASRFGHLSVRWDVEFKADRPLSAYAADALEAGYIRR